MSKMGKRVDGAVAQSLVDSRWSIVACGGKGKFKLPRLTLIKFKNGGYKLPRLTENKRDFLSLGSSGVRIFLAAD